MMATNPVRTNLVFNGLDFSVKEEDEQTLLEYANKKTFLSFAWGAWVTSLARERLEEAIRLCTYGADGKGHDKFVYCDTDSVKFIGNVDFTSLNKKLTDISIKHGAYADDTEGNRYYLGVYEREGNDPSKPTYTRFETLGSKKYVYEDEEGKLHITIAGVNKQLGAKELGCIENFQEGFVFKESAGLEAVYNDLGHEPIEVEGHTLEIPPNIYFCQGEYTLGVTMEYKSLFHLTQEQLDKIAKTR